MLKFKKHDTDKKEKSESTKEARSEEKTNRDRSRSPRRRERSPHRHERRRSRSPAYRRRSRSPPRRRSPDSSSRRSRYRSRSRSRSSSPSRKTTQERAKASEFKGVKKVIKKQPTYSLIEVEVNDRLGKKARVKCAPNDLVGDFKKLVAAQIGTDPSKIVLKKWYKEFKDHITLADYEIHDGMNIELYYQ